MQPTEKACRVHVEVVYLCRSVSVRYSISKRDDYVTDFCFLLWPDLVQGEAFPATGCVVSYLTLIHIQVSVV